MVIPFVAAWIENGSGDILVGRQPDIYYKPYKGLWDFPAGKIEFGESPEECLIREVREETGFVVESAELVDVFHNEGKDTPNKASGLGLCYKVKVSGEFIPNELEDMQFISKGKLKGLEFAPWTKYFLREFLVA
ncbi:NUDIX hydrolase [bacterium]|nr:NUDIX hydrolase [bacterium]